MPADALGVAGEFGEQVPEVQDHGFIQRVRNDVDDAPVGHDVPDAPAVIVPLGEFVVASARGSRSLSRSGTRRSPRAR